MRALLPGSYDPCTIGHLAVIEAAAARFDEVTVAVFINPEKHGLFSYRDRVTFLQLATAHLPNVNVTFSDGMVADFAKNGGYTCIVKGIRNEVDRCYEEKMAAYNLERGGVPTELVVADAALTGISSTAVRTALAEGAPTEGLLPPAAREAILDAYRKLSRPPC